MNKAVSLNQEEGRPLISVFFSNSFQLSIENSKMYKGGEKEIKKEIVKTVLFNTFFPTCGDFHSNATCSI